VVWEYKSNITRDERFETGGSQVCRKVLDDVSMNNMPKTLVYAISACFGSILNLHIYVKCYVMEPMLGKKISRLTHNIKKKWRPSYFTFKDISEISSKEISAPKSLNSEQLTAGCGAMQFNDQTQATIGDVHCLTSICIYIVLARFHKQAYKSVFTMASVASDE